MNSPSFSNVERLRVKAFAQDNETKGAIEQALKSMGMWESENCVTIGNIAKSTQYLNENRSPEILIVDIDQEELPISKIKNLSDFVEPGTRVIIIGIRNDVSIFRELVQLGVNDYIVKPLVDELVAQAIGRLEHHDGVYEKKGRLVFFTGTRGGSGSSTLLQLVAQSLSLDHFRRVVIVDLDFQFGSLQPTSEQQVDFSLKDLLTHEDRIDELLINRSLTQINDKLFVLGNIAELTPFVLPSTNVFEKLFKILQNQFHIVLVDLPRYYLPHMLPLLPEAKSCVLTLSPSLISLREAIRFKKMTSIHWNFVVNHTQKIQGLRLQELQDALNQEMLIEIPYLEKINEASLWNDLQRIKTSQLPASFHDFLSKVVGWGQNTKSSFWPKLWSKKRK
jgi:pilus assembly protein CpaE